MFQALEIKPNFKFLILSLSKDEGPATEQPHASTGSA